MKKIDIKNLKYILDWAIDHESPLDAEEIAYEKFSYPQGFFATFNKAFSDIMGHFDRDSGWEIDTFMESIPSDEIDSKPSHFETYYKFVQYKDRNFVFKLMFGQGSSEEIYPIQEFQSKLKPYKVSKKFDDVIVFGNILAEDLAEMITSSFPKNQEKFNNFAFKVIDKELLYRFMKDLQDKD